jgi:uncharacterized protein (TIGR02145 family)
MRNLSIIVLFFVSMAAVTLNAQPVQTVQATVVAGGNADHFYAAVGQPFFQQAALGDYELAMGVAQAQWTRDTVYGVITYNTDYTENGFDMHDQTESHKGSVYLVNGGIYNYDVLRTLYLIVCPENLADASNISYDVLAVSGHCWTKQNLRTRVDGAMAYTSVLSPEVPEEYGLLYTWNSALAGTSPDADGYVQGICPTSATDSWHLPDATEIHDLMGNPAESLRSLTGWVIPDVNTNSTGFTAYPAGLYNALAERFEGLGTQTDWWTSIGTGETSALPTALHLPYYCDTPQLLHRNPSDAISVRCVMKNEWPE